MRTIVFASACFLFVLAAGCGGDGGGSGGTGGAGGSGGSGGSGGTGGSTTTGDTGGSGGSGAAGGSGASGGNGGGTTTATDTETGGSGGGTTTTGPEKAKFAEPCTVDDDCEDPLVCFNFNAKGKLCTLPCQSAADCPAPSSGCNGMGYCKPN
jgi:hypothetical protein